VQRAAEQHGLLYVPDPSSQGVSTIGGNIACNAGGPRCLKYGVTTSYVLGLTAVLSDGRIVRVGDGLTAQTPDTGLLHLLAGSEGTLGVITEATLGLIARPAARRTTLAFFARLDDACATVEAIMASGVLPAGLELMDDTSIRVVEDALHLGLPREAGALLLMLADGEPEAVEWEAQQLAELARRGGASQVQVAGSPADEAGFWQARRSVSPAFARVQPNKLGEDICVPLPQIATTVRRIKAIAERFDLPIPVFGHAGDGNLHPNILFDRRDADQRARAWQAAEAIFTVALEVGGTLSGEHGIGTLKRPFLAAALGDDVLALHHAIKGQLDPRGLLNPGKVV
jgi:glycolate oxidase subunit GlcD